MPNSISNSKDPSGDKSDIVYPDKKGSFTNNIVKSRCLNSNNDYQNKIEVNDDEDDDDNDDDVDDDSNGDV